MEGIVWVLHKEHTEQAREKQKSNNLLNNFHNFFINDGMRRSIGNGAFLYLPLSRARYNSLNFDSDSWSMQRWEIEDFEGKNLKVSYLRKKLWIFLKNSFENLRKEQAIYVSSSRNLIFDAENWKIDHLATKISVIFDKMFQTKLATCLALAKTASFFAALKLDIINFP